MNNPNNEIDPRLKVMLDELNAVPARDPKLASGGRARFLSQAVAIREEAVSIPLILRLREWLDKFKQHKEFKMTTFVSIIAILGLLMGGSAGTVYASQDSLPNEMLYPVKIASEEVRMNFAGDAEQKLDLALEFAQNRSDEIDALLEEGEVIPEETMTQLRWHYEYALQVAGDLEEGAKTKAVHRIRNMMQIQVQHMTNLEENAPEDAAQSLTQTRVTMENQLRLIDEGLPEAGVGQQDQGQGQGQGQGSGSGRNDIAPGNGSGQGQQDEELGIQNTNMGEDPCAAYYESLAQEQGQSQGQGQGQGQSQAQGESQGPTVYGLNGEACVPPTEEPVEP